MEEYITRSAALSAIENAAMKGRSLSYVYHEIQMIPASVIFGCDFGEVRSSDFSPNCVLRMRKETTP